ncbi:MAG TPA: rhodanese-like domain-containing protein [Syntrophobacteraceae bacterium]|nr:rhodanese-like domain-containing protein [Syntrophobacteraceae bacterium]
MRRSNFKRCLLASFIVFIASSLVSGAEGITLISKDQLKEELAKPDLIVIDVRASHDWNSSEWKIAGARRESPTETKEWMTKYPRDKTIVLYCA